LGSGTTAVAAQSLNRKFIGCELSEKYCEIAPERLRQKPLF
ncbi:site-specific DNA-methyltransferase, partial [Candidatus Babeliales bacterium]|nr:site-specific DNA-methyltransferase [Candidatus Babeliales bacterium]